MIAAMLAALMSSLSAVFNSSSTIFTMDFYREWKPQASERELVRVGRLTTVVMVAVSLAWIPFMSRVSSQLWVYLQSVQAYISPPITAVFLLGVFWKRINGSGAMAALITGFILGALRFILEVAYAGSASGRIYRLVRRREFSPLRDPHVRHLRGDPGDRQPADTGTSRKQGRGPHLANRTRCDPGE
jgi:SSS family solute:Na+ symporter